MLPICTGPRVQSASVTPGPTVMQFEIDRLAFLAACQVADAAAATRALAAPILACIKVVATDDQLLVMGADPELGVRFEVPVSDGEDAAVRITKPGAAVLPPDKLLPILRHDGAARVHVRQTKEAVQIKTALGRFDFTVQDVAQFPDVTPAVAHPSKCGEIEAGDLSRMLERVSVAVSKDAATVKWTVTGYYWEVGGQKLTLAGTDTRRMAIATGKLTGSHPAASAILPRKAVAVLQKAIAAGKPERVSFAIESNLATFGVGPVEIHTKLLEGRFPPFRDIIPKRFGLKLTLPRAAFTETIRQAAIMSGENHRLDIRLTAKAIDFAARTELGRSDLRMPIEAGPEKALEFGMDPRYLLDGLDTDAGESFECQIADAEKPVVFRDGPDFTYFVMPMVE